jgi:hypothetical protein
MSLPVMQCPECEGLGQIPDNVFERKHKLQMMSRPKKKCDFCDGKRFVVVNPDGLKLVNPKKLPEEMNRIIDKLPSTIGRDSDGTI